MKKAARQSPTEAEQQVKAALACAGFICDRLPVFLRRMRELLGLTKYELAKRTGLRLQTITQIESGECLPTPHTLTRLAFVLFGALTVVAPAPGLGSGEAGAKASAMTD